MQDEKYQQKSQSISSAEPNYFVHFAMRHPVLRMYLFRCSHFRTQPGILEKFKSILAVVQYQLFFVEKDEIATEFLASFFKN